MPREQITRTKLIPTDNPNVYDVTPERHVHLGFNRHGQWIQVGIEATVAELEDMVNAAKAEATKAQLATPEIDISRYPFMVWSTTLDRSEANSLVKHARRARDAAYGRDE